MSNELKPCPKGCDSFIDVGTREIDIGWWSAIVRCADCGIELRRGAQSEKEALEKAIEAWNTRAEREVTISKFQKITGTSYIEAKSILSALEQSGAKVVD